MLPSLRDSIALAMELVIAAYRQRLERTVGKL